jgi:hypothetical protein
MQITGISVLSIVTKTVLRGATCLALLAACVASRADEPDAPAPAEMAHSRFAALKPRGFFAQFGVADEVTAETAGLIWNLRTDTLNQRWGVYLEGSVSRW